MVAVGMTIIATRTVVQKVAIQFAKYYGVIVIIEVPCFEQHHVALGSRSAKDSNHGVSSLRTCFI